MRWALPLIFLSLLAGCTSAPPGESIDPAGTPTTTTMVSSTPPSSTPPTASTPPPPSTPPTQPTPPSPTPPTPAPAPASETFEKKGNVTGAIAGNAPEGAATLSFTVKPNAVRITAILTWNATGPTDYDLKVFDPRACGTDVSPNRVQCAANATGSDPGAHADEDGTPAAPDSPAKVELDLRAKPELACAKADGCKWTAEAFAKTAAQAGYHLVVVVDYA